MMAMRSMVLLALCMSASADDDQERPVAKVVRMLKDMTTQLQKEADTDAEMYEEMSCWCETGDKQKAKDIALGEQRTRDLGATIEETAAKSQQLATDIEALEQQVEDQTNSLNKATGIRDKELAEFVAEEKDMTVSITSLKGAVITLGRAHGEAALVQVKNMLKKYHGNKVLAEALTHKQRRVVMSLIQTEASTPASGEIFGVLKQMKESFENNLATGQKEEAQAAAEYVQLKEAKTSEIAAANGQIESKTVQKGDTDEANAQAQQDLKDTTKALEADREFLAHLEATCATADAEYEARVKVRTEEIQAVSETMGILTNEEANDAFTKVAFLQVAKVVKNSGSRAKAANLLKAASKHNPRLVTLATSMRLDAFAKVKANIDTMVGALKQEQKDEVTDRDQCIKDLNTNERQTAKATDEKNNLDQKIADLEASISQLTDDIAALNAEVTSTQIAMKKATATREAENKDFQMTVSDQRATQAILTKALDRLKAFYEKKALLQEDGKAPGEALAAPPAQAEYAPSKGAGGVMAMIQDVVKDSVQVENDAILAEQDSQTAYEGFVKDSNNLISDNRAALANKSEHKARDDGDLATAKGDLKNTIDEILKLGDLSAELHAQCDFLLKNFDERQSSRIQEMDALNQAKAIFSGMN